MDSTFINFHSPRFNLDVNAQRVFIKYHNKLREKPVTTVRFFDRTDFYSVHDQDDCQLVSNIIYKSSTFVQQMEPEKGLSLPYVTLSKFNFENAVRELLLVKNYRVEVFTKVGTDWEIQYRGSPGNLLQFEDVLFSNREVLVGNVMLSIQIRLESTGHQRKLGVAAVEQNLCLFQVSEFLDDDFFTELEATLVLIGPKECIIPSIDGEYSKVKELLERNNIMVTLAKRSKQGEKDDFVTDLNRLLHFEKDQQPDANTLPETNLVIGMEALREAIKYLDLVNDIGNEGQYKMKLLDLQRFVHLDPAAISALHILPKPGTTSTTPGYRWQSILGVLDRCKTPQGHRLMAQWIKQPLRNKDLLNDRHNVVQCFLEAPEKLNTLYDEHLKRVPDILLLTKRLMRRKASLQDLFRVYQVIVRVPHIIKVLQELENPTINSMIIDPMQCHLQDLNGLKTMVEHTLDFEAVEAGDYLVKASFDDSLQEMKDRLSVLFEKMSKLRGNVQDDLGFDGKNFVKMENVAHLGFHFRITLKGDIGLRKNKKYRVIDVVKSGVRFTNEKMQSYSEAYAELRCAYEAQQKTIVDEIIKIAVGYAGPLMSLNNELAQLDCLVSFAIAAQSAPTPYVRPKMLDEGSGVLKLIDNRHPCLELQEDVTFISNNVDFTSDECNMVIITGPNMGGKSTYIRSVGTSVLMAHVGSFVPCSEATISMVDSILGRIGASDNLIKGLSTFMVEMIETSGIVRTATNKSLVIIDELGRGTSTYEGCGIAWAVAEHLAKEKKCFSLFATHFHEITVLSETVPTVKNFHMAALVDEKSFTLLYEVRPGPMKKSFGIQIARLAKFPDSVVDLAEEYYRELDDVYADKQGPEDQELLGRLNKAIENLSTGNNNDINDTDLTKLVEQFSAEIKKLDSDYFKAVLTPAKP